MCFFKGICYGFEVMRVHESPNTPFNVLFTRFPQGTRIIIVIICNLSIIAAPSTVIYDNACNLHQYCLNREPVYFKHTWFLVDRFHWLSILVNKNILQIF